MRVLQINSVCGRYSTGTIMSDLAEQLIANGDQCLAVYGRDFAPEKCLPYSLKISGKINVYMHAAVSRVMDNAGFGSAAATRKLLGVIEDFAPDIVHLHNIHGYYIHIGILFEYLKKLQKPVIWTLHDQWAFTGHCSYSEYVGCEKWKQQCYRCEQKKEYPASFLLDCSKRNYQKKKHAFTGVKNMTLVTPSHWLSNELGFSFLSEYPKRVIPNGIDLSSFTPSLSASELRKQYDLRDRKIILAVSSNWEDGRKGFDDVLRLADLLGEEYQVVIIGVRGKQKKCLPKTVLGIERTTNREELASWYAAANVFVNPTYEDNYPTVNMEAQVFGTPVITYPSGGSPEAISPISGFVTGDKNVLQMAALVPAALQLDRSRIQERALSFDKKIRYQEYLDLYRAVLL